MMKTIPTLLLTLFILPGIFAQQPIRVYEDSISFGKKTYPGVAVTIPEANYVKLEKEWKKELEAKTKSRVVIENGEWSIFGANVKDLSPNPVNIFSKLKNQDSLVELRSVVELKKDVYVEKQSSEMLKLETYLKEFAKSQYIETATSQLNVEEDTLRQFKKLLSEYERDESRLKDDIKSAERSIKEQEDNLSSLNADLETLSLEINNQNAQLTSMSEGSTKDDKAKYIKELDKRKKKLGNDIGSSEKKIKKANQEIEDANKKIPDKQSLQEEMKKKIADQELVVKKYEAKLDAIKLY
jgi:chromosome segregation ATPase